MKFVNKLSVLSLIVLMFSFMNVANAVEPNCLGFAVNYCNQSKTSADCNNSYRFTQPSVQCEWNTNAVCSAIGVACTASAGLCKSTADCPSGNTCIGLHCYPN